MAIKLKTKINQSITNITVEKSAIKNFTSKNDNEFKLVTIGDFTIMFNPQWINENKTGTMSVGIKKKFEYNIFQTDSSVMGIDLVSYFFSLKEEENKSLATEINEENKSLATEINEEQELDDQLTSKPKKSTNSKPKKSDKK